MKIVKQKDMSQAIINKNGEGRFITTVIIEEPLLDYWLEVTKHYNIDLVVEDVKEAFFDPGGMISAGEPTISVEVCGQKLRCWLRDADVLADFLRKDCKWAEDPNGPPHCYIRGRWINILLTTATAKKAADAFEKEFKAREHEAKDAEHRIMIGKIKAGVATKLKDGRIVLPRKYGH